jgi:hypothetical protein
LAKPRLTSSDIWISEIHFGDANKKVLSLIY